MQVDPGQYVTLTAGHDRVIGTNEKFNNEPLPYMPAPTIFRNARTRVCERSITFVLNCSKFFHPELPASTAVVTPLRRALWSGFRFNDAP